MKVALIHDWLIANGGAEKVLLEILAVFPDADIFCLLSFPEPELAKALGNRKITTSFLQTLPFAKTKYRNFLPLMPIAVEQFDLSPYDLVISSSHAVAKGVLTTGEQVHCSYVHSPMRYAWDLQTSYLAQAGLSTGFKRILASYLLHKMRIWDYRTANGVDLWIANSRFIARRIHKVYGKQALVCYPPVDTERFGSKAAVQSTQDSYFVVASRLVQYKRIDLIVDAFSQMTDKRLVVAGTGPELEDLRRRAGKNIEFRGWVTDEEVSRLIQGARGFVFAAEEDFGIVMVEAQAAGVPVIAYGRGGAAESVIDGATGILYERQTIESLVEAVSRFERSFGQFNPEVIMEHARQFSRENFRNRIAQLVSNAVNVWKSARDLEPS